VRAQYDKLKRARQTLDVARSGLEHLTELGDMVSPEDVIKEAGKLVAHGLAPQAMAGLLADIPTGGGLQLAEWVKEHLEGVSQREAQLQPVLDTFRHRMGVQALMGLKAAGLQRGGALGLQGGGGIAPTSVIQMAEEKPAPREMAQGGEGAE